MSSFLSHAGLFLFVAGTLSAQSSSTPTLDYSFFKERVQPIFLKKRPGHARCITCHVHRIPPLEELKDGAATWDDKQSRRNFEMWSQYVVPGRPLDSSMLLHLSRAEQN